jgi:hypothetical protein
MRRTRHRAVDRLVDQRDDLVAHVVEVGRAALRRQRVARGRLELRQQRVVRGEHVEQAAHPRAQRVEVRADEADRIVDLVRDAGRELADRRELFRLQQLHVVLERAQQRRCSSFSCSSGACAARRSSISVAMFSRVRCSIAVVCS